MADKLNYHFRKISNARLVLEAFAIAALIAAAYSIFQ